MLIGIYCFFLFFFLQVGVYAHGYLLFLQVSICADGFYCRFEIGGLCAHGYMPQYLMLFAF